MEPQQLPCFFEGHGLWLLWNLACCVCFSHVWHATVVSMPKSNRRANSFEQLLLTGLTKQRPPLDSTPSPIHRWTSKHGSDWEIAFDTAERSGKQQIVGLHITASELNKSPITAELIRNIPLASLLQAYLQSQKQKGKPTITPTPKHVGSKQGTPLGEDLLQLVAAIYRQAINTGQSPTQAIAQQFDISESTAAKRIQKARQQHFLGKATPGKPGERR